MPVTRQQPEGSGGATPRSPAVLFAVAWGTAGLVATLTGEAESLVAGSLAPVTDGGHLALLPLVNVAGWWTLSGAFRGLVTALVLRPLAPRPTAVPSARLVMAFASIWLATGLLHYWLEAELTPAWSSLLLLPLIVGGGVVTWAAETAQPVRSPSRTLRSLLGWGAGFLLFLTALQLADAGWARCGLPTAGPPALGLALALSAATWALYGAVGGAIMGAGRAGATS